MRRLERQLAHEAASQRAELAAESDRLRARFAHERIMNDLEELRGLLDDAAKNLAEAELADTMFLRERQLLKRLKPPPAKVVEKLLAAETGEAKRLTTRSPRKSALR